MGGLRSRRFDRGTCRAITRSKARRCAKGVVVVAKATALVIGARFVGGRFPFFGGGPVPSWVATQRRTCAGRPMSRLWPSGPRTCATPAWAGSRARRAATSPFSRGTTVRRGPDTRAGSGLRGRVLHLVVDRDQAQDLVFLRSRRHAHLDHVALLVVEEAFADRGRRRDATLHGIGLFRGHEVVGDVVSARRVLELHGRAEADLAPRDLVEVDEGERGQPPVKLADARLQEGLALLGRLVLGVLAQVAVLAGALDLLGELDLELVVEPADLLFQPLLDVDHVPSNRY